MQSILSSRLILPSKEGYVFAEDETGTLSLPRAETSMADSLKAETKRKLHASLGIDLAKLGFQNIDELTHFQANIASESRHIRWILYAGECAQACMEPLLLDERVSKLHVVERSDVLKNRAISNLSKRAMLRAFTHGY